jgi:Asp/Glu/hydantoin racemase
MSNAVYPAAVRGLTYTVVKTMEESTAAIMALRERTRIAELRAKVAGRIQANQVNVLNLNMDEETAKRAMQAFMARNRPAELTP